MNIGLLSRLSQWYYEIASIYPLQAVRVCFSSVFVYNNMRIPGMCIRTAVNQSVT
jgi:hypothetical protein